VHETTVAYGGQQEGKGEVEAQHASMQVALRHGDRVARPERDVLEDAAVLAERDLAFGASVQIVKNGPGQSATRDRPEIFDTDYPRRATRRDALLIGHPAGCCPRDRGFVKRGGSDARAAGRPGGEGPHAWRYTEA
jgi:hypothetical protein